MFFRNLNIHQTYLLSHYFLKNLSEWNLCFQHCSTFTINTCLCPINIGVHMGNIYTNSKIISARMLMRRAWRSCSRCCSGMWSALPAERFTLKGTVWMEDSSTVCGAALCAPDCQLPQLFLVKESILMGKTSEIRFLSL